MEFVRVLFPTSRRVRIDGSLRGSTNKVLQVGAGTHRFMLDGLANYSPPFRDAAVTGTTLVFPLMLQFVPLAFATAAGGETAALDTIAPETAPAPQRRRKPAAKKPGKKPAKKRPAKKKPAKKKTAKKAAGKARKPAKKAAKRRPK